MKSAFMIRLADKNNLTVGSWKHGKMPRTVLKTKGAYQLAGSWSWKTITFDSDGEPFIILLAHRADRQDFMALLAHNGKESTILCRVEHHGSHPGWHVHYQAERPYVSGVTNFPHWHKRDCGSGVGFGTNMVSGFEAWAMTSASVLFGIVQKNDVLL